MKQVRLQLFIDPDDSFPPHADFILPPALATKWRLVQNTLFTLSCGSEVTGVRLLFGQKKQKVIAVRIRKAAAHKLGLYQDGLVNLRYLAEDHRMVVGPILGILTNGIGRDAPDSLRFGNMTRFYKECHFAAMARGMRLFVFSPKDLDVREKRVDGWTFIRNRWRQLTFPLPDVVYNRITSRRIEAQKPLQQKLKTLKTEHRVQLFNEKFLDKWQVHTVLSNDHNVRTMLPVTRLYKNSRQLREMMRRFPVLYIKPVGGSLGQGVMRLTLNKTHCHMQYTTLNGVITKANVRLRDIAEQMARRNQHNTYLIQQGLPLITSSGRPVDFRALVQKNGRGAWSITSIVGRIAGDANIVSNVARGGTVAAVPHILKQVDAGQPLPTAQKLRQHALRVARAFERETNGHFAELGIDLAADQYGKVWLLEINAKPSKTDDAVSNPDLIIRPSVHKTLDYTCYITGYVPSQKARQKTRQKKVTR